MEITIKIDDAKFQRFASLWPSSLKKSIVRSLNECALLVQNAAKLNAPYKTGNLRRSITNLIDESREFALVGTAVVYAAVREFKTYSKPEGYLRPALKDNIKNITKVFEENINKQLK